MKRFDALLDALVAKVLKRMEPQLEALLDRQVERMESRLRSVVSEIRDDALEAAAPLKSASEQIKEATGKAITIFDVLRSARL